VIDRIERVARRGRRLLDRSEWAAHVLGLPRADALDARPGLVMVQIDGLSSEELETAVAGGTMPFVAHLVAGEGYRVHRVYSGVPSTTPAVQAELFYGVRQAVPAFAFVDHRDGRIVHMWQHEAATSVEHRLEGHRPLLAGGTSYANIFTGGAVEARFCMASLGWSSYRSPHSLAVPALVLLFAWDVARAGVFVGRELLLSVGGVIAGVAGGQGLASELKFASTRALVGVALRELTVIGAAIDVARGVPIVHLNLLGYDETSHRRGPGSAPARRSLRDIDAVVGRVMRAARRSSRRAYDVWVLSDHGQEQTEPYVERHGSVHQAVARVFRAHGMEPPEDPDVVHGAPRQWVGALGERLLGLVVTGLDRSPRLRQPARVTVTAQGPLGHVYSPRRLTGEEREAIAGELVRSAGIPLVLAAGDDGTARAWTQWGSHALPADAAALLGESHPHLPTVAAELAALCHHPDAGDLVISGWRPGAPMSFPGEHGSHGGPGPRETDAFVLAPEDAPLSARGRELRTSDVRAAALELLDGAVPSRSRLRSGPPATEGSAGTVRLMTYNVHSCVGLDGKLSPERIARVIARHDPDVVALQELDVGRARTGWVDQARAIAEQLEMLLHFHPTLSVEEEHFGDAVLSRLPMRVVRTGPLPRLPHRPPLEPRGALWAEVGTGAGKLQVINTHLSLHPLERRLQVRALLGAEWLGAIEPVAGAVLCGDFNALGWFPVCRRIAGRLRDVQVGRRERPRGTWSGRLALGRIDHVFVDHSLEVAGVDVPRDALAAVASDHLPLIVDLVSR